MTVMLRRLHPPGDPATPQQVARELRLAELAPPDRPYVAINMAATADGKVALGGRSRGIGDEVDRELFHAMRAEADAVMVGAGTLRAERYGRLVRDPDLRAEREGAGLPADPLAIVVSGRLELDPDLPLFAAEGQRVVVITASERDLGDCAADVAYLRQEGGGLALTPALRRVREEHAVRSVLCEGGPGLNAALLAEDLMDELLLSLAPKLAGGADGLTAVAGTPLDEPAELDLVSLLGAGESLFLRYRVRR